MHSCDAGRRFDATRKASHDNGAGPARGAFKDKRKYEVGRSLHACHYVDDVPYFLNSFF